jgi:hypothetical protein
MEHRIQARSILSGGMVCVASKETCRRSRWFEELEEISTQLDAIEAGSRGDWTKAEPCLSQVKRVVSHVLTALEHTNDIDELTGR